MPLTVELGFSGSDRGPFNGYRYVLQNDNDEPFLTNGGLAESYDSSVLMAVHIAISFQLVASLKSYSLRIVRGHLNFHIAFSTTAKKVLLSKSNDASTGKIRPACT